jgi:peroxiredoxin Q/BCP
MLTQHAQAPDFSLPDASGKQHALSDYLGSWVLIYFYPKDDTPGCTKEACMLRDAFPQYQDRKIVILGISKDSSESHTAFSSKYELPFTLLSDAQQTVIKTYDAEGGLGTKRISYLIDPKGEIAKSYAKVDPATHADEVLKDVEELSKS